MSATAPPVDLSQVAALLREPRLFPATPAHRIPFIVQLADSHGVTGLLVDRARAAGMMLGDAWAPLRERAAGQAAAAVLRDAESLELLRRAHARQLPLIVLKGLALAHAVYPEPWLRERSDTDLLVREHDLSAFERLFLECGYSLFPQVRGELTLPQRQYVRVDVHGFRHTWDLHWRITASQALRFAVFEDDLWSNATRVPSLDGALAPAVPDALLIACIHRLAHHFDDKRLLWLWDIRLLLERLSESDEVTFLERVRRRPESAAASGRSLAVARDLVGAPLSDRLRPLITDPPHSHATFLWSGSSRRVTYFFGEFRAARPQDRLALLRERLFPSWPSMRERYPSVPGALLPLAYLCRLANGVPKWIRRS